MNTCNWYRQLYCIIFQPTIQPIIIKFKEIVVRTSQNIILGFSDLYMVPVPRKHHLSISCESNNVATKLVVHSSKTEHSIEFFIKKKKKTALRKHYFIIRL